MCESLRRDMTHTYVSHSHAWTPAAINILSVHVFVSTCTLAAGRKPQCVAVCCSVLQCVGVCCSVLQCVAVCRSVLQCVAA